MDACAVKCSVSAELICTICNAENTGVVFLAVLQRLSNTVNTAFLVPCSNVGKITTTCKNKWVIRHVFGTKTHIVDLKFASCNDRRFSTTIVICIITNNKGEMGQTDQ